MRGRRDSLPQVEEMGRRPHVLSLNAVSRQAAASLGWQTISMEPLISYFSEHEYLRDLHHPAKKVSLAALNVLLNIVAAHVPSVPAPVAGLPGDDDVGVVGAVSSEGTISY